MAVFPVLLGLLHCKDCGLGVAAAHQISELLHPWAQVLDDYLKPYPVMVPSLTKRVSGWSNTSWHYLTSFPFFILVQAAVIPALLESADSGFLVGRGGYQPSDLCVSAPTGSGKTLAFVIPVVQVSMGVQLSS